MHCQVIDEAYTVNEAQTGYLVEKKKHFLYYFYYTIRITQIRTKHSIKSPICASCVIRSSPKGADGELSDRFLLWKVLLGGCENGICASTIARQSAIRLVGAHAKAGEWPGKRNLSFSCLLCEKLCYHLHVHVVIYLQCAAE